MTAASGHTISFEGGESADYDGVVWATGFRVDHSWIDIPEVKDEHGQVRHVRGVTDSPGLYLLGMTWQYTRTSALLGWVGIDAAYLADRIEATKQTPAGAERLAAAHFVITEEEMHTHHEVNFSTDVEGLDEAKSPEVVRLRDGETHEITIKPVRKRIGDAEVRMLGYNGSIPGPDAARRPGQRGDDRGDQPR